jgi:tRNA dimethylallyltransferase
MMYHKCMPAIENRVILLVGPTCVGKTETSVLLAEELGTEIIGADSMQIYRQMNIGTEKPTPRQMERVRHHMIDIVSPSEGYSAGRYLEAVKPIVRSLAENGRIPIVSGGTGLYIKAMTRGLFKGPGADQELRGKLLRESTEILYSRLKLMDPTTAEDITPTDKRRIVRALEVCIRTGRKMSEIRKEGTRALPCDFIKIALFRDRKELYGMIDRRVDRMFESGLVKEVERLMSASPHRTPMQAIGYKETAAYLRGECSLEDAIMLVKRNTRRYAKRQFTWFRKEEGLNWVDITGVRHAGEALERIRPILALRGI